MIKKVFKRIRDWLLKNFNLKKAAISCGVFFLTFLLVFPVGSLSNKTINEVCADYYAKISREYTVQTSNKKLSGLLVEPKDGTSAKVRQDTDNAITELWGVFKGENASFAPVMNVNRDHNVYFSDKDYSKNNLSFIYTNVGQSTEPYHINKATEEVIDHKFQSSPIALMFSSGLSGMQDKLHIYISQTQAENKLIAEGKEVTKDNLKGLQWKETTILIDGTEYECVIDNIYLDNFQHQVEQPHNPKNNKKFDYYYATDIGTIIGDFVFVIFYAYKHSSDFMKKQSLYVMSEYSFRNDFYLEYAKESYSSKDFSFDYARSNLKEGFDPDKSILQKTLLYTGGEVWSTLLSVLITIIFFAVLFFVYRYQIFRQPLSLLSLFAASFVPYLIFKLIFTFSNNTYIFSSYSLIFTLILFAVLVVAILILNCFGRRVKTEAKE